MKCYSVGCQRIVRRKILVHIKDEGEVIFYCCRKHAHSLIESAEHDGLRWERLLK